MATSPSTLAYPVVEGTNMLTLEQYRTIRNRCLFLCREYMKGHVGNKTTARRALVELRQVGFTA